jgi:hypothetical protein
MKKPWLVLALAGATLTGTLAFVSAQDSEAGQEPEASPVAASSSEQPVAFPHNTHAGSGEGQFGIDCQYCHFSAERSVDAGIPPVASCMGCHSMIPGRNNPEEVTKVREYFQNQEPIPWVRIYKVADHVHYPHMRHIAAGLECQQCHGEVQEMGVIQEVNQTLSMGWCVSCHLEQEAAVDCTVCHY